MKTSSPKFYICVASIAVIIFAVFIQLCWYDFIGYDDNGYILKNKHIQSGLTAESIKWAFTKTAEANWHPLTWLSLMADYELWNLHAGGYHLTNLLLHIANSILLFWLLLKLTNRFWPAAFVAIIFGIHPLHVESVAWVVERKDVLSTVFWLLAIGAYADYANQKSSAKYLLAIAFFVLSLMAKPMAVTLPFLLLLLDYWPLERLKFERPNIYFLLREKIPFFILSAASSAITLFAQGRGGAMVSAANLNLYVRLTNAIVSYLRYAGKTFWPRNLSLFYPYPPTGWPIWQVSAAAAILILITIAAFLAKRHKWLTVGWLWYLGTLIPVIGIVQVGGQSIADRYMYVPMIGLLIIIAWTTDELLRRLQWRVTAAVCAGIIIAFLALLSWVQASYWRNSISVYEHSVGVTKGNFPLMFNLAFELSKRGENKGAIHYYTEYLKYRPADSNASYNLALHLIATSRPADAAANITNYIADHPNDSNAYYHLGVALTQQGFTAEAVKQYQKTIEMNPDDFQAHNNLGALMVKEKKYDEAIEHFKKVLELRPQDANALSNLNIAESRKKQ